MPHPLFSVIIPAYNASKFISNTLDSVRLQTFEDYEVIIINDGSTDNTEKFVSDYMEKNQDMKIILMNQSNKGLGAARNTGIRNAKGEYISLLDADDIWHSEKLEKTNNVLNTKINVDVICHDEYWFEKSNGRKRRVRYGPSQACTYRNLLFKGNKLSGSATTVKKDKLFEVGLFAERRDWNGVEDYDMWLKLAKNNCKFFFLNEVLGEYILHDTNMTAQIESFYIRILNVLEHYFSQWPQKTVYYCYLMRKRRAATIRSAGRALMKRGNYKHARRLLITALQEDPLSWKTWLLGTLNIAHVSI
jgi:glycosyltransferase involved in cell wall biosynthesis